MGVYLSKLNRLREISVELQKPSKSNEKVKEEALKIISELNAELRSEELDLEGWNEVFEVIHPYTKFNLAFDVSALKKIQNFFSFSSPPENSVQSLSVFVEERRIQNIQKLFKEEKARIIEQYQPFIENISVSKEDALDKEGIRKYIVEKRKKDERLIFSAQDEVALLCELCHARLKALSNVGSMGNRELVEFENLKGALHILQSNLFAFDYQIESVLKGESHETGAIILAPNADEMNDKMMEHLRAQRLFKLENLEAIYKKTAMDPNAKVANKFFESTCGWYIGAFQFDEGFAVFESELQKIGEKHGIKVISEIRAEEGISESNKTDLMLDCDPVIEAFGANSMGAFPQDFIDFSRNGEIRVPRMKAPKEKIYLDNYLLNSRKMRSKEWKEVIEDIESEAVVPLLGGAYNDNLSSKAIALASTLKITPSMNLTYNEGGNTLIGTKEGQPYVIIGQDSYAISKLLMENDLGREMSEHEIKMAFAIDYGVLEENVYYVEQPGDFHLDMSMTIIGENTILLNDAVSAQSLFSSQQQAWLADAIQASPEFEPFFKSYVKEEAQQAEIRKKLEDVTAENLKSLGFNVVRIPGRFHYSSRLPAMNFFNIVTAKTPVGENIVIALGCTEEYAENFKKIINENCDQKIDKIYLLDLKTSQECLGKSGGISCRTKTIPSGVYHH